MPAMPDLNTAAAEYLRREEEANRTMRGADHMRIMDAVAQEYRVDIDALTDAVLRLTFSGAN